MPNLPRRTFQGRIVDPLHQEGIEGAQIELLDRATGQVVATTRADATGAFTATLEAPPVPATSRSVTPRIDYEIRLDPAMEDAAVTWSVAEGKLDLATVTKRPPVPQKIAARTFDELLRHEPEILDRLAALPNGGQLFLIHPFMALADVGVELGAEAQATLLQREPQLSALSVVPYQALKASRAQQHMQVRVHGLFRRDS